MRWVLKDSNCWQGCEERATLFTIGRRVVSYSNHGISTDISQKVKTKVWFSCSTPGHVLKDCIVLERPNIYVCFGISLNSKEMEPTYLSIKR